MTSSPFQAADPAAVRERVQRILARDEFGRGESPIARWIGERLDKAAGWLKDLLGMSDPTSARVALYLVLGIAALALLWAIARLLAGRRRGAGTGEAEAGLPSDTALRAATVAGLRREARIAARRNDHVAALRLYFRALVLGLSERGELRYRDAWTNREILERGAPRRDVLPLLAPLVPRLDAQSFGREPAFAEDVARIAALCDRLLGGLEA